MSERKPFTTTIDEDIQASFKAYCKDTGATMNDVLEAFMQDYAGGKYALKKKTVYTLDKTK
jgi:NRPS condensation-like uncharacterized protein